MLTSEPFGRIRSALQTKVVENLPMVKIVYPSVSPIWHAVPPDIAARLENCIDAAHAESDSKGYGYIFFRADDIAAPSRKFEYLINSFACYRVPLSMAVVPAWLSKPRWGYLRDMGRIDDSDNQVAFRVQPASEVLHAGLRIDHNDFVLVQYEVIQEHL